MAELQELEPAISLYSIQKSIVPVYVQRWSGTISRTIIVVGPWGLSPRLSFFVEPVVLQNANQIRELKTGQKLHFLNRSNG
jgi:hypothetical protein